MNGAGKKHGLCLNLYREANKQNSGLKIGQKYSKGFEAKSFKQFVSPHCQPILASRTRLLSFLSWLISLFMLIGNTRIDFSFLKQIREYQMAIFFCWLKSQQSFSRLIFSKRFVSLVATFVILDTKVHYNTNFTFTWLY